MNEIFFCFYDSTIQRGQRWVRMDKWSISQVILSEVSLRLCSRMLCGREIVMWETVKNRIIELIECLDMCEQKSKNKLGSNQDQFGPLGWLTRNWFSGLNLVFHLGLGPYLNLVHAKILLMWHLAKTNVGAQTP